MPTTAPRLDSLVPEMGFRTPDEALDAFLGWCGDSGLRLYAHQEEAILELFAGHHVVLDTPTGSGKSLVATALHFKTFAETGKTWYTAPIKALVSEKFFALCDQFGAEYVGMATGDGALNRGAPIVSCTAEILANLALREGESAQVASAVMDEFHYYADRDRGSAWQIPLLALPRTQFLLLSATLGDTQALREDLERRTGRRVVEVKGAFRPVPLHFSYSQKPEHEAIADVVRSGRGPVYVVHFTQSAAAEQAQALTSTDWCTKEEKKTLQEALRGFRFTSPYGPTIKRYLQMGIGLHHAGLLPRYRLLCEKLAQQGLLKVICGTDTLGVGINVPIRTVLFTQLCKFDGARVDILKVRDFRQIAGRAGRAGFDTAGYVVAQAPPHIIENLRAAQKAEGDAKKLRKLVKAQPPERGYKHWDETTFNALVEKPCERLEPRLAIDHGRLLIAMQQAQEASGDARGGVLRLRALIEASHQSAAEKSALLAGLDTLLHSLVHVGVVHEREGRLLVEPGLQKDFSLHHSLSLFLVGALGTLDMASPTYALDVLSWVESILENPKVVLERQQSRDYQRRLNELKAAGVPYEERVKLLEDLTYPKPLADEIYAVFNAYAATHPWVEGEGIRPKGVAREMAETFQSFADYVKELGLQRSEGVLLRYLSDVYRALVQNVPTDLQTEPFRDLVAWLRASLAVVDSSLVTEWEALAQGQDAPQPDAPRAVDISQDRRAFHARVRAELHALVRALAQRDWEEASDSVRRGPLPDAPWSAGDFEFALAPFLEVHGDVAFDHRARLAGSTVIRQEAPHQWIVRQRLFAARPDVVPDTWGFATEEDADEGTAWGIQARIDLRADTNPDGPLLELVAIGE